ncbi:MAG: hypothetical protein D6731_15630 [Planctomycetota bacterium]|nr:MAG: hypothetical protein D6731_15630 [Planctomycetota bacterium]
MLTALSLLLGLALQLHVPGATVWQSTEIAPGQGWSVPCTVGRSGLLLLELQGLGSFVDVDLQVRGAGWEQAARGHRAEEVLLLPVLAGEQLRIEVPPPRARARFRLGATLLLDDARLGPGTAVEAEFALPVRAALFRVPGGARIRLRSTRGEGPGQVLLFDGGGDLVEWTRSRGRTTEVLPFAPFSGELFVLVRAEQACAFALEVLAETASAAERRRRHPLQAFVASLARTPAQRRVLAALGRQPDFVCLRAYLEDYPGGLPLDLQIVPGLEAHGVERFGTYSRGSLAVNPTIAPHQTNPQELVDTLVHELVHAVLSLPRAPGFPLAPDVLDSAHDPRLQGLGGAPLRRGSLPEPYGSYLAREYGPSASNPSEDYTDINSGAQRLITKVITENLERTGLGKKTLVFANVEARRRLHAETK